MSLRILTINLFNGRAECDSLASALREHSPDVVAVQELSANATSVLADWGTNHLLDPRDDITGMGIATSRSAQFSRPDFPNRNPILAHIEGAELGFPDGIDVINAHLVNPIARPLRTSRQLRRRELAALEQLLTGGGTLGTKVLVGDLNSSPAWPLYRRLSGLATDAAVEAGTAKRSWGPTTRSPRMLRIDHAFTQGARCVSTRLVHVEGSDHRGLLVDLEPSR